MQKDFIIKKQSDLIERIDPTGKLQSLASLNLVSINSENTQVNRRIMGKNNSFKSGKSIFSNRDTSL